MNVGNLKILLWRVRPVPIALSIAFPLLYSVSTVPLPFEFPPEQTRGQKDDRVVVLEHADSLIGKILEGENVRELIGSVRFRQGKVTVACDQAIQYLKSERIALAGNVIVRDDTITLRGSRGVYYSRDRTAEAFDAVRLEDGPTILTAAYGRYHVDEKKAFFRGSVVLEDTISHLTADELTYFREDKHSVARGNVEIVNREDNTTIRGNHFENFALQNFSRMTEQPQVMMFDTTDEATIDTLTVLSRVMEAYRDTLKRFVAIDSVRMWNSDLAAEAGYAIFFTELDSIILRIKPFVWHEENQLSGDSIFVKLLRRRPETVYVRGYAFAVSLSDSSLPDRLNQLTGELIVMTFAEEKLRRIAVEERATSLYYLYEEEREGTRLPNGLNKATGDHVVMEFRDGRLQTINVVGGVEGEYYPEPMVEGKEIEYNLPGLNWRKDRPGAQEKHGASSKRP